MKPLHLALAAAAVVAATLTLSTAASEGRHRRGHHDEDGDDHESERGQGAGGRGGAAWAAVDPTYAKECGACHLAYPPAMLPAASWRAMMGRLDRHFGQDAELDDATRARLEGWLAARAGPARPEGGAAPQRITERAWFVKEHRQATAEVVARPAVRTLANCAACHPGAGQWDFEEDRVRIPR